MTTNPEKDVIDRVKKIGVTNYIKELLEDHTFEELDNHKVSLEPWLYDPSVTKEDAMFYKLKDRCHVCGISPRFHRDDCPYSMPQLHFAELDRHDIALGNINSYINSIIGEFKLKNIPE